MKKRVLRGAIAASVSAAIIGGCIFMTNGGKGGVDVNAASVKAESVVSESVEIPSEYPSEAVYLHFKADLQKQKNGQDAWKKAQAEKKAAEDKKKADEELAAKEQAANDAMRSVWNFPNGCLKDGATRDMLNDAQAKIEALPEGNATRDALYPAIAAADNAFTVLENQQKAAEEQSQQTQNVSDAQVQQIANEISYTTATVDASSFGVPDNFNDSAVNCIDGRLQQVAWNIISAVKNNQSGIVSVGTIENDALYQDYTGIIDQAVMGYFGIDNTGYVYCDENGEDAFCMELPDGSEPIYIMGADAGYNLWQTAKQKFVNSQQLMGQVPVDEAERVRAINDRVCQLLTYDYSYSIYDADTALATGTGVCEAYAQLFHRIAMACGLQDRICVGPTNNGYHAWNQTMVNGQWLYTDSTWNDCLGNDSYLMSSALWSDHLNVDFFE